MDIYEEMPPKKPSVHKVLIHSYICYFLFLFAGMSLDVIFNIKLNLFDNFIIRVIGVLFMIFSALLIFWAQRTSRNLDTTNINIETFSKGPYKFTRNPTHIGLLFLLLGFGVVYNTPFVFLSAVLYFFVAKMSFLKKEEEILFQKYGEPYLEYKKSVRF
jgi:protein-S-isoprenylcysteine O-methyltransferase Ste14